MENKICPTYCTVCTTIGFVNLPLHLYIPNHNMNCILKVAVKKYLPHLPVINAKNRSLPIYSDLKN